MAYQAEYLDLITNVRDQFTDDLTRLSALLETIEEQADAISPIRLRVTVQDRQLRRLQGELAATSGISTLTMDTPSISDLSTNQFSDPHEAFRETLNEWDNTIGDSLSEDITPDSDDDFTADLTRLSALLKTVETQANIVDPISIRVDVEDRELRRLQSELAATSNIETFSSDAPPLSELSLKSPNDSDETFNIHDDFTADLTRLSTLLKTVETQADAISPLTIRVDVEDRQLRQLQGELAATSGISSVSSGAPPLSNLSPASSRDTRGGLEDILSRSDNIGGGSVNARETFERALDGWDDKIGDSVSENTPHGFRLGPDWFDNTEAASNIAEMAESLGGDDDDTLGSPVDAFDRANRLEDALGINLGGNVERRAFSPVGFTQGTGAFEFPSDMVEEAIPPSVVRGAFDSERFGENVLDVGDDDDIDSSFRGFARLLSSGDIDAKTVSGVTDRFDVLDNSLADHTVQYERLKHQLIQSRVGLTAFYDVVAAGLPAMLTFIGSIPALAAALGGLAATAAGAATILGGIAGLGILGAAQQQAGGAIPGFGDIQEVFDGLGEEFVEAFRPITERLAPLIQDGVDAMSEFFDMLAASSERLLALRDEARGFGQFAMEFVSGTLADLIAIGEAAAPLFARLGETLQELDVLRSFTSVLTDLLPQLFFFGSAVREILPDIVAFSEGMSEVAVSVFKTIGTFMEFVASVISLNGLLGNGNKMLGKLVGGLLSLSSILFISSQVASLFNSQLLKVIASFFMTRSQAAKAAFANEAYTASAIKARIASMGLATSLFAVTAAFAGLVAFVGVFSFLANEIFMANQEVESLQDNLSELESQRSRMNQSGGPYMGDLDRQVYADVGSVDNSQTYNIDGNANSRDMETHSFIAGGRDITTLPVNPAQ